MAIRLRIDYQKRLALTHFSREVGLREFAKYASDIASLPQGKEPFIHFSDITHASRVSFDIDQMMPHAEQIVTRLAHGCDVAAAIILAPHAAILPFAKSFREIAADSFPLEVYADADRALDRLNALLSVVPQERRVPSREFK